MNLSACLARENTILLYSGANIPPMEEEPFISIDLTAANITPAKWIFQIESA